MPLDIRKSPTYLRYVTGAKIRRPTSDVYILVHVILLTLATQSKATHLLGLWVPVPLGTWISVCCACCVSSGRGLCVSLITCPEESY